MVLWLRLLAGTFAIEIWMFTCVVARQIYKSVEQMFEFFFFFLKNVEYFGVKM